MSAAQFTLSVMSPEKDLFEGDVTEVVFTTPKGRLGVMAGHAPMVVAISAGVMEILVGDEWKIAAVGQGFSEIAYDRAEFYLDTAEWADDIDAVRAKLALERAAIRLHSTVSRQQYLRTQAAMSRALARLKAVESSAMHKTQTGSK